MINAEYLFPNRIKQIGIPMTNPLFAYGDVNRLYDIYNTMKEKLYVKRKFQTI